MGVEGFVLLLEGYLSVSAGPEWARGTQQLILSVWEGLMLPWEAPCRPVQNLKWPERAPYMPERTLSQEVPVLELKSPVRP